MKKIFKIKNIGFILFLFLMLEGLSVKDVNNFFVSSLYANEKKISKPINNKRNQIIKKKKRLLKKPYKKISYAFFKGKPQYARQIKLICDEMIKDGRGDKFSEIVGTKTEKDPYCIACKEIFDDFKDKCKEKVKKVMKPKKGQDEEKDAKAKKELIVPKRIPQREPSLALVDLIDSFFTELAQDEKLNKEATRAVIVLLYLLKNYEPLTVGEKEYFDNISVYIKQPFKELIRNAPDNKKLHEKEEKQLLHNLFGQ